MRALATFKKNRTPVNLLQAFQLHGINVDCYDYDSREDALSALHTNRVGAPYSVFLHDGSFELGLGLPVFADVSISDEFTRAKLLGCYDSSDIIRRTYLKVTDKLNTSEAGVINVEGFEVNLLKSNVKVDGLPLNLSPKEFSVFRVLSIYAADRKVKKEELLQHVYGIDTGVDIRTVEKHLIRINQKIKKLVGDKFLIHIGVKNTGYSLSSQPKDIQTLASDLEFSKQWSLVRCGDKQCSLGVKDAQALELLISRRGGVVSNDAIGPDDYSNIKRLRKAMREVAGHHYILGVYGIGYQLVKEPIYDVVSKSALRDCNII